MYQAYLEFKQLKEKGLRDQANAKVPEIIEQFRKKPDPAFVSLVISDAEPDQVHFELYREIVFPAIKKGYRDLDSLSLQLMIRSILNIYRDKQIHAELEWVTETKLLETLVAKDPSNEWAKAKYIAALVQWLAYCVHEWPNGVLYGANGASRSECDEILAVVEEVKELDAAREHLAFLEDVASKTMQYRQRFGPQN